MRTGDDRFRLVNLENFGLNPGCLKAATYIPAGLLRDAALVVVLHGSEQTAAAYDHGSGWSQFAERHGFALLFPEQQRVNNTSLCFNWFVPGDSRREAGEALSIRQMVDRVVLDQGIDRERVFITGLSAGGAMAAVMLATYPDVFAGGAIIAGLPYGCASTVFEAVSRMMGYGGQTARELGQNVRRASSHEGPWPTLSIWHGSADYTVHPSNLRAILGQWCAVHDLAPEPTRTELVDGCTRRIWCGPGGRELIEEFSIKGMGHGIPSDSGHAGWGASGTFMLGASISSTRHIARFWGLEPSIEADADGGDCRETRGNLPSSNTRSRGITRSTMPSSLVA